MKKQEMNINLNLYLKTLQELGLFIQDVEKNISYPNYIWEQMGYTKEEMPEMGFLKFVHPDDLENVEKSIEDLLNNTMKQKRILFRMKNKAGDWRWILSTSLGAEYNNKGKILKYFGYDHDVTTEIEAKENAERALKEVEILKSVGEIITYKLNLPETIKAILEQAERVITFTSATVQLLKNDELEIVGVSGLNHQNIMVGTRFPIRDDIPNYLIINNKEAVMVNKDLALKYPGFVDPSGSKILSWMGVPLIYENQVTGIMTFDHSKENQFQQGDLKLAQTFTHQVAIALENSRLYEKAKEQAIRDPLTGCFTRRHLFESIERECDIAKRYGKDLSLIIFDIDDFKLINDNYGHLVGDDVLKRIVELAGLKLRKTDILCRYGGEEFIAVLPSSNIEDAEKASERIRKSILSHLNIPPIVEAVSISLGCTQFKKEDGCQPETIIERADMALYKAKNNGKNQSCSLL